MAKSARLRMCDLRAAHRLVGECRDLGDDAAAWCRHVAAGTAALTDNEFGAAWTMTGLGERAITIQGVRDWGWENGLDWHGWQRSIAEFSHDPFYSPVYARYFDRLAADDGACLARTDLVGDREWQRSRMYRHINRVMGVDHYVWCYRRLPGLPGDHLALVLARTPGRRDYAAREKALVRETYAQIAPLVGGPLAGFRDPQPHALPPRVRQVLKCLLEGDSDKQVAARLRVSPHTAHQYVMAVYRHFGVTSRAELLARWVRRGWNSRCEWAGGSPDPAGNDPPAHPPPMR